MQANRYTVRFVLMWLQMICDLVTFFFGLPMSTCTSREWKKKSLSSSFFNFIIRIVVDSFQNNTQFNRLPFMDFSSLFLFGFGFCVQLFFSFHLLTNLWADQQNHRAANSFISHAQSIAKDKTIIHWLINWFQSMRPNTQLIYGRLWMMNINEYSCKKTISPLRTTAYH